MNNNIGVKCATNLAVFCYGLGDLASQFVWTFVGSYLTVFYTDVVGFTPAIVSIIMLVARVWDAINDPMMGSLAENTRSKFGRFRPYIAFGAPFLALFSVLTFVNMGNGTGGIIFSAIIYIIAGMIYTLVNIPYSALAAVMTEDANQRNLIGTSRAIGMNIGMIIVNTFSAGLILRFSGSGAEAATGQGYVITAIIYAVIATILFLIVFFATKEVIIPENTARKISPKETISSILGNKYMMIMFLIATVQFIGFFGRISITAFYVIYCLGAFSLIALIMTIPAIGGIFGSILSTPLAKKVGKKNAFAIAMLGQAVGLFIVYFAPFTNMTQIMVGHAIYGIFNLAFPICLAMVADCVDFQQHKTGVRMDGSYYAVYGLSTKLGNAIGSAVGILIMAGFGYIANQDQTPEALAGINLTVNLIPAILLIIASIILILLWDKSDADFDNIRKEIKERNV